MPTGPAEIHSLSLMVQRLLDAELLLDTEGAALLAETAAAGRALEEGDAAAARQHLELIARFVERLVGTGALEHAHGRVVIETVRRILVGNTG